MSNDVPCVGGRRFRSRLRSGVVLLPLFLAALASCARVEMEGSADPRTHAVPGNKRLVWSVDLTLACMARDLAEVSFAAEEQLASELAPFLDALAVAACASEIGPEVAGPAASLAKIVAGRVTPALSAQLERRGFQELVRKEAGCVLGGGEGPPQFASYDKMAVWPSVEWGSPDVRFPGWRRQSDEVFRNWLGQRYCMSLPKHVLAEIVQIGRSMIDKPDSGAQWSGRLARIESLCSDLDRIHGRAVNDFMDPRGGPVPYWLDPRTEATRQALMEMEAAKGMVSRAQVVAFCGFDAAGNGGSSARDLFVEALRTATQQFEGRGESLRLGAIVAAYAGAHSSWTSSSALKGAPWCEEAPTDVEGHPEVLRAATRFYAVILGLAGREWLAGSKDQLVRSAQLCDTLWQRSGAVRPGDLSSIIDMVDGKDVMCGVMKGVADDCMWWWHGDECLRYGGCTVVLGSDPHGARLCLPRLAWDYYEYPGTWRAAGLRAGK